MNLVGDELVLDEGGDEAGLAGRLITADANADYKARVLAIQWSTDIGWWVEDLARRGTIPVVILVGDRIRSERSTLD